MEISFDPPKRHTNLAKHGYDFGDLTMTFFEAATIIEAGQERLMAIGWLGDDIVSVVFRLLGSEALSVISMRPSSRKERRVLQ